MSFVPHTQEELEELNIKEHETYKIQYLNKDYFNGEETMEIDTARVIKSDEKFIFIVTDPYGMDKFVHNVRVFA